MVVNVEDLTELDGRNRKMSHPCYILKLSLRDSLGEKSEAPNLSGLILCPCLVHEIAMEDCQRIINP